MGRAPLLDLKGPLILKKDYTPSFPLRLMHKDVGLGARFGAGARHPASRRGGRVSAYSSVKDAAKEDLDYSAVAKFWDKK